MNLSSRVETHNFLQVNVFYYLHVRELDKYDIDNLNHSLARLSGNTHDFIISKYFREINNSNQEEDELL